MTKKILFLLLLLFPLTALADERLKRPLRYVTPDSVLTWGSSMGGLEAANMRKLAVAAAPEATPFVPTLTKDDWKNCKLRLKEWHDETAPVLNAFGGAGDETADGQTIAAAAHYAAAAKLLRMTGEATFADVMERTVYNALMREVVDTASFGTLNRAVAAGILFSTPGVMYATDGDEALYVNFYANSTAVIPFAGHRLSIDQLTRYPLKGEVRFRLMGLGRKEGVHFKLLLRLPDWAGRAYYNASRESERSPYAYVPPTAHGKRAVPQLYINGHEVDVNVTPQGYILLSRAWRSEDEVRLVLPMSERGASPSLLVTEQHAAKGVAAQREAYFQYGPCVYAPVLTDTLTHLTACYYAPAHAARVSETELTRLGFPLIEGKVYDDRNVPADATAPERKFVAMPMAEMGAAAKHVNGWVRVQP